ncbi:polyprotein [Salmovirus WFRC1]|uniref:polyprotein n=1 Tax=Salmovirus WFRC1 TaxID=1981916 RepID=UPI000A20598F|nr:polyprotein [Salmovirus WFRC1]ARK19507.1 polyprotein [Salmovirus WFRC1]
MFAWSRPNSGLASAEILKFRKPGFILSCEQTARLEKAKEKVAEILCGATGCCRRKRLMDLQVDLSRSPGYPYKYVYRSKKDSLEDPIIYDRVMTGNCWRDPAPLWDAFGKFEILPVEKALKRCRLITSPPVDVALCVSMWYEDQNERLMSLCESSPYGVGISKFTGSWNRLMSRMPNVLWQCDVSQFDACIRPLLMSAVYDVRELLFEDIPREYYEFRDQWLDFLIDGSFVDHHTGDLYSVHGGNKSGSPNTSSDNTIANMIVLCYSMMSVGVNPMETPFVCYGDDLLLCGSVPEDVWAAYTSMGMIIKPGACKRVMKTEVDFLSCKSLKRYGQYVPVWNSYKAAYSMMVTDSKGELLRGSRFKSLLLESLFVAEFGVLSEFARLNGFFYSRSLLECIFFGMEVEDKKEMPGKKRNTKTKQSLKVPASRPQKQKRPRRRRQAGSRTGQTDDSQWFMIHREAISTSTQSGVLFSSILHPSLFPATPYYTRCSNFTHRIERSWEFRIMITTASFTGSRVAVIPVNDPSPDAVMSETVAFQQVANGRAAIATSTGASDQRSFVKMYGATTTLSNANPSVQSSLVGFSVGTFFVYLLDPPIGLAQGAALLVTVLARVALTVVGPFTGFLTFEANPTDHGAPPVELKISDVTKDRSFITHSKSSYLDFGRYLAIEGPSVTLDSAEWAVKPEFSRIYASLSPPADSWYNNQDEKIMPEFYTEGDLGGGVHVMIGWPTIQDARTFTVSPSSVVNGRALGFGSTDSKAKKKWSETWSGGSESGQRSIFFVAIGAQTVDAMCCDSFLGQRLGALSLNSDPSLLEP